VGLTDELARRGEIGGRTVHITARGEVECAVYPLTDLAPGMVRVRTEVSVVSPGTELTYIGRDASNPYLHKAWDPALRIFAAGAPTQDHPIVFGYRAAGTVVASEEADVTVGTRVFGKWRHTEFTTMPASDARVQRLPDDLSFDDGADLERMLPIALNAVAFAEGRHAGAPAVIFGCGPVGLLLAQVARATGADPVYAVDRLPQRLAIARSLGLEAVDAGDDAARRLKQKHGAEGVPVAFECSGSARALHEALRTVRRRGIVVAVGFYQGEAAGLFLGEEFHHNGVEIRSGQIGNLHPTFDAASLRARSVELALSKSLVLGGLPRTRFPVERAGEAFAALARPADVLQVAFTY
jgi:NADPH:quinone reductase-like Zn-dependent oxidoreductase